MSVRFKDRNNSFTALVTFNGVNILGKLDTGAFYSAMSVDTVSKLFRVSRNVLKKYLDEHASMNVSGIGGSVASCLCYMKNVTISKFKIDRFNFLLIGIDQPCMLLGYDFITSFSNIKFIEYMENDVIHKDVELSGLFNDNHYNKMYNRDGSTFGMLSIGELID